MCITVVYIFRYNVCLTALLSSIGNVKYNVYIRIYPDHNAVCTIHYTVHYTLYIYLTALGKLKLSRAYC